MLPAGIGAAPSVAVSPAALVVTPLSAPTRQPAEEELPVSAAAPEEEPSIEIQGEEENPAPLSSPRPAIRGAVPTHYPSQAAGPGAFWTVEIGGETLRPGGVAALRVWARQGKLRPEDRVRQGEGPWQTAREIPELASLFPRAREAKKTPTPRHAAEARRGWLAGLLGGAGALLPVMALLIFSGEFERLGAAWGAANGTSFLILCSGVLFSGALTGRALAYVQTRYDRSGAAADVWSAGGAVKVGGCVGLTGSLPAMGLWSQTGLFKLLIFFSFYGVSVAFLTLLCYRWLFVERRT